MEFLMRRFAIFTGIGVVLAVMMNSPADAHIPFKNELSKKYPNMKINCNACHVEGKPKPERNEFGKLFAKELKPHDISATYKSKKGAEKKKFEQEVMVVEFKKALAKIQKMKPKDQDQTYDELIKAGEMADIVPKPEKDVEQDDDQ